MNNCLLVAACCLLPVWAHAEQKPLWEAGLGLGVLGLPDYRGSDESRAYLLPFPYLIYRGAIFKADREGARAELFDQGPYRLDLSVNASVPVSSRKNRARLGMPDLNGSLELGPALDARLYQSADERVLLKLRIPLGYGVTLGKQSWGNNGWQATPHVNLDLRDPGGWAGWNLGMLAGPIYGSRRRNAYFYDVAPAYATADRPAYQSRAGYAGFHVTTALSRRFDRCWVGAFVRYDDLGGAVFADSPLVKSKSYLAAGFGVAWVFGQSSEVVDVER